jgi:hypothetical protein
MALVDDCFADITSLHCYLSHSFSFIYTLWKHLVRLGLSSPEPDHVFMILGHSSIPLLCGIAAVVGEETMHAKTDNQPPAVN